jgi:hypothetical protein
MNYLSAKKFTFFLFLFFCTAFLNTVIAQDKPLLSEEIRKAIDTQGIEGAKKQFAEPNQTLLDKYNIDMQGISTVTNAYVQAGKMDEAGAVAEISSPFLQYVITSTLQQHSPELAQQLAEQQRLAKEKKEKGYAEKEKHQQEQEQQQIVNFQGQPRDDLERFKGLYGDPEGKDQTRKLWVTVSCDGYLVSGAMWGDVAPWWMKSTDDNVFTYQDSFNKLRMEFETDANGKAVSMKHDLKSLKSPLERVGPLPDDLEPCLERSKR